MHITLSTLNKMAREGQKIAMLTCYDASFAALMENAGVEVLLVGDSLGMVIQGFDSTLPVSIDAMVYHTRCVARGTKHVLIIADMPFASYQVSPQQAFENAARLMAAGAHMVKLEGGVVMAETIAFLTQRGIPVCAHIGLTPQSVNQLGGYKVQGKTQAQAHSLVQDAQYLVAAGAAVLVLEAIPAELAKHITHTLDIPTIGIGAGADCSGQVLVIYDLLGVYPGKKARFVKNFMQETDSIQSAVAAYVKAVKDQTFPTAEHSF